jgi:hypothetical protein
MLCAIPLVLMDCIQLSFVPHALQDDNDAVQLNATSMQKSAQVSVHFRLLSSGLLGLYGSTVYVHVSADKCTRGHHGDNLRKRKSISKADYYCGQ